MKKALLWLCPLACLALACLYAYAWFVRDPLAVAFERIEYRMTLEQAEAIMGGPGRSMIESDVVDAKERMGIQITQWDGERQTYQVISDESGVNQKAFWGTKETFLD